MSNVDEFLGLVRAAAPEQAPLIASRAELLRSEPARLLNDLIEKQVLEKARLNQLWADSLGVAYVNPTTVAIPTDATEQLPVDIARRTMAIVLSWLGDTATVGMAEPANARQVDSLGKILGKNVSPVYAHPDEIRAVIDMYLGSEGNIAANLRSVHAQLPALVGAREINSVADVADFVDSRAIIELLNSIILTAYRRRASDIHLEPRAERSRVRMRIDGDMETVMELPNSVHLTLVARVKVLCRVDVSQSRLPQDGAFEL